jgi:hypothetical protein
MSIQRFVIGGIVSNMAVRPVGITLRHSRSMTPALPVGRPLSKRL